MSLTITNNAILSAQGQTITAKQGTTTDAATTGFAVTGITGLSHQRIGSIATATVNTLYDATTAFPATSAYLHFWADQTVYLQLIGTATNFTVKCLAKVPFVLPGFGKLLAAAATTLITGGTEPTTEALQKVVVGNYSGFTANYTLLLVL